MDDLKQVAQVVVCVLPFVSCDDNKAKDVRNSGNPADASKNGDGSSSSGSSGAGSNGSGAAAGANDPTVANHQDGSTTAESTDIPDVARSRGAIPERKPKLSPTVADQGDPKHTAVVTIDHGTTVLTDWGECVAVANRRRDKQSVAIPYREKPEFESFKKWAKSNELDLYPCYCKRPLTTTDIHRGIQNLDVNHSEPSLDLRSRGPQFGQEPDYYIDGPTITRLCQLLACGPASLLSSTKDVSPEDNTRAVFQPDGSGGGVWNKFPAKPINRKIDHRRPTLYCGLP